MDESLSILVQYNTLKIENGSVSMIESDCKDGICIKQGSISFGNQTIVCLANKIVVQLESATDSDVDIIIKIKRLHMGKKVAFCGVFSALAIILSYLERIVILPMPVPGIKLGLANIVIVIVLYTFSEKEAFWVSIIRILSLGILFSGMSGILYSLAGGVFSFVIMVIFKKINIFSIIGVSVLGGVSHNIAQIITAAFVVENSKLLYYIPFLIIAGIITGVVIGMISYNVILRLNISKN